MCPAATLPASIDVLIVEDDPIIRLAVAGSSSRRRLHLRRNGGRPELLDIALQCHPGSCSWT